MMPRWLRALSTLNPLTYAVDGLRTMMLQAAHSHYGVGIDFLVYQGLRLAGVS